MLEKIPVILDGDPGHDDAIAWVLANADKRLNILAVTTSCGNQTIEKTTHNARQICTLIGLNAPIAKGAKKPMVRDVLTAGNIHGESGLDGAVLPVPDRELSELCAADLIANAVKSSDKKVTIIATGPLTNIATFLLCYEELKDRIEQISLMGGGIYTGNFSFAAEFNILVDPEAADIVFKSGIKIIMSGLDVTLKSLILPEDIKKIRSINNKVSDVVAAWLDFFLIFHMEKGYKSAPVHDAVAVISVIHKDILDIKEMFVEIDTKGEYCTGATIGDIRGIKDLKPNAQVVCGIDRKAFVNIIINAVKSYSKEAL